MERTLIGDAAYIRCLRAGVGAVLTASDAQVRRPITAAAIGKWRRFGTALEPL